MDGGRKLIRCHGIDRIDSGQGYIQGNVVTCCAVCNQMKSDLDVSIFLDQIGMISLRLAAVRSTLAVVTSGGAAAPAAEDSLFVKNFDEIDEDF